MSDKSFSLYPKGFPKKMLSEIVNAINYEFIGNKHASGTDIIEEEFKKYPYEVGDGETSRRNDGSIALR